MTARPSRGSDRRRRGAWRVAAIAALTLAGVWLALCVRFVAHPRIDPVEAVDALFVLGPLETRIDPALALMDAGVAPLMLATTSIDAATGQPYFTQYCGKATARYRIDCVVPEPYTTAGEARLLGDQVRSHGWTRVAILVSTAQAERARLLMARCVPATVLVWDYPTPRTAVDWLGEFVHQGGGMVAAAIERDC